MPYAAGDRLGAEHASKLGHLEIVKSEFVQKLIDRFTYPKPLDDLENLAPWTEFDPTGIDPLPTVIAVDGSLQTVASDDHPVRQLSFVKTALVRLDRRQMDKIDRRMPHPVHMKALMRDSALQTATVFPLRNVKVDDLTNYDLVRHIIRDSLKLQTDGIAHETLKWLAYQKWDGQHLTSPKFDCPHCAVLISEGLPHDANDGPCPHCRQNVFISDMIGLHMEMSEDAAPESLAKSYMLIHETLLLFSVVRFFWERQDWRSLGNVLFVKDGPLTLRAQYSKLVPCIRNLLTFATTAGTPIHLIGQEKTGFFVDHLSEIARFTAPRRKGDPTAYAALSHRYVREEVYRTPDLANPYGFKTNYGEKVLVKLDPYCSLVINVPTGQYLDNPDKPSSPDEFIGLARILVTLPSLISYQHEGALIPITLANGVASLSNYPSAAVLKLFAGLDNRRPT
jgi:hypothetical protein